MTRLKILIILLSVSMVMSSCSRRYGHLTRRTKGTPTIVQKGDRQNARHQSKEEKNAELVLIPEDVIVPENVDPIETDQAVNAKQNVTKEQVVSSRTNRTKLSELVSQLENKDQETIAEGGNEIVSKGPLGTARQVNKLRKEIKSRMDTPSTKDDVSSLLYIILVVILILLILSLLTTIFGGWFTRLLLLVVLIILIIYLLGKL